MAVTPEQIQELIEVLNEYSQYDFSQYSVKSFTRRVERILVDQKLSFDGFLKKLKKNPKYLEDSVRSITVNTTELFRDPKIWHAVKYKVLPDLMAQNKINIWHAGVSFGQELYSMLILLSQAGLLERATVFGTDVNSEVLDLAQKGVYKYRNNLEYIDNYNKVMRQNPYNYEEFYDVPYEQFFSIDQHRDTITMQPYLLKKPVFLRHNLVRDGNIFNTKFDVIFCRNVLIYFTSELQNYILQLFHESLFRNGTLILGAHESILGPMTNKFQKKGLYYRKK